MFSPSVPEPVNARAVTVQVVPEPDTDTMLVVGRLLTLPTNWKWLGTNGLTEPVSVTVHLTEAGLQAGLVSARLIDATVTAWFVRLLSMVSDPSGVAVPSPASCT